MALNAFLLFYTTRLCGAEFSAVMITKPRNQLTLKTVEDATCPVVSHIQSRFNYSCKSKPVHTSFSSENLFSSLINYKLYELF